ncbi:hemerythrin domain-containing protein [Methanobacterium sp. ACI-7]|uniref:hemerythrin domain-containing protein n=1 Tax=unclassified Methanobacterium TaxID=2627676 RepID=UPI0039C0AD1E
MVNENQEDVGEDIIRFHRIITRSLEIIIQNVNAYLEIGATEEENREGFLKYIQTFSTVMDAHHVLENERIFPYFMEKLPDALYDRLMTQHEWIKTSLSKIGKGINNLESNIDELDSLNSIKTGLKEIDKIWHPHIRIEEERLYGKIKSLNLSLEENNRLREEFFQYFLEHTGPENLVVPFVLYNLSGKDRAIQVQQFPKEVTKLANWKDEWASMKPFLLE